MSHPLASLPQVVVDAILQALCPASLASCSLVCKAWRDLPYEYATLNLIVDSSAQAAGILKAGLHRCRRLHTITVSSSKESIWQSYATVLAQQQLPSLRELHIQHSSDLGAAHLQQLADILQAQGGRCALHLALTDKASLQALLPLLPLRGLASLELNVPYLADGVLQLLLHACALQAPACSTHPGSSSMCVQTRGQDVKPPKQDALAVKLWVCCWGGCPGLPLQQAVWLHSRMQQLPSCSLLGCESVNISSTADLSALSQLQGVRALGVNFTARVPSSQAEKGNTTSEPPVPPTDSPVCQGLQALTTLSSTLQGLSFWGHPKEGWATVGSPPSPSQQQQAAGGGGQPPPHWLCALTRLTKLSVLKDWAAPALPVLPLAGMTLLQELALERSVLQHAAELCCLSSLTALRTLSLVLTDTADRLAAAVRSGQWQLPGSTAAASHQQWEAVIGDMKLLVVDDTTGQAVAGVAPTRMQPAAEVCSCGCCSAARCDDAAAPGDLLQAVLACPELRGAASPVLLDWSWLRQLQQLEVAWLQVPHLDLSCLPRNLVELDAQQPHDHTAVSITCSSPCRAVHLPRLQRLVLPRPLPLERQQDSSTPGEEPPGSDSSSEAEYIDTDGPCADRWLQHHTAALLLAITCGCPELKTASLVQWELPAAAVEVAATHLAFLRELIVLQPDTLCDVCKLHMGVAEARARQRLRQLDLQLQERPHVSRFPWLSRVLNGV